MKAYLSFIILAFGTDTKLNNNSIEDQFGPLTICEQCESQIETPFIRYFSDFTEESKVHGLKTVNVPIVIKFSEKAQKDSVGICIISENIRARRYIFIDKMSWNKVGTTTRKALIFHELAHCLLNVNKHADNGIMSEIVPYNPVNLFDDFWKYVSESTGE